MSEIIGNTLLTGIAGLPLDFSVEILPLQSFTGGEPLLAIPIAVVFLVGLFGAYLGYGRYQKGQLIEETETAPIGSVTPGRVGISGTVRPVEEPLKTKFTDDECVYYGYRITDTIETEKEDEDGNTVVSTETERRGRGSEAVDYYVEDDTGVALIPSDDGLDYSISSENSDTFRKKRHQPIEDPDFTHGDDYLPSGTKQRSYKQSYLPVGEEVFVMGRARGAPTDENTASVILQRDEETDTFLASDEGQDGLAGSFSTSGLLIVLVSLATSAVTLYMLVSDFLLV
ncbi:GIDE domain-containing protein [Halobellus captivus]|uniref:GIDE domain-containing protein n=1 Tax=Halobellus captivus TaxID=2592614 RepID=UPI00119EB47A|nr:GIDE domain-containing protein [Halobellus captivus]